MKKHPQRLVLAALGEAARDLVAHLAPLLFIGRVDVEKPRLAAKGLDLVLDPLDVAQGGSAVEMNADDVASGPRQKTTDRFAEAARSSEDERPTREGRDRDRRGGRHDGARRYNAVRMGTTRF